MTGSQNEYYCNPLFLSFLDLLKTYFQVTRFNMTFQTLPFFSKLFSAPISLQIVTIIVEVLSIFV